MNPGGDAADAMARQGLQLSEQIIKLSALGAKNLAALCIALANDNQKLKGKTNMTRLLKDGKELKVFNVQDNNLQEFAKQAKQYGVLFSVIKNTQDQNGNADVIAKAEDVSKINRILERIDYATLELGETDNDKEAKMPKKFIGVTQSKRVSPEQKVGSLQTSMKKNDVAKRSIKASIEKIKENKAKTQTGTILPKSKER